MGTVKLHVSISLSRFSSLWRAFMMAERLWITLFQSRYRDSPRCDEDEAMAGSEGVGVSISLSRFSSLWRRTGIFSHHGEGSFQSRYRDSPRCDEIESFLIGYDNIVSISLSRFSSLWLFRIYKSVLAFSLVSISLSRFSSLWLGVTAADLYIVMFQSRYRDSPRCDEFSHRTCGVWSLVSISLSRFSSLWRRWPGPWILR